MSVDWITFDLWMWPASNALSVVGYAEAVIDRGNGVGGRRKIDLVGLRIVEGELLGTIAVPKESVAAAKSMTAEGSELLVWGWPVASAVAGNLAAISEDGSVRFLDNCIPRFNDAFRLFAAGEPRIGSDADLLVRILTDPTGPTAQRFRSIAGTTKAGS